jgi:hypothetical protein
VGVERATEEMGWATYNLAFFFGPGLPRTLGGASGPRAAAEFLLIPFFLMPSDGGGMDELGVPTAAGVLGADSDGFPLAATATESEVVGEETSLRGDSSFTEASDGNLASFLGVIWRVMMCEPLEDFRRAAEDMTGCFPAEAIATGGRWTMEEGDGFADEGGGELMMDDEESRNRSRVVGLA